MLAAAGQTGYDEAMSFLTFRTPQERDQKIAAGWDFIPGPSQDTPLTCDTCREEFWPGQLRPPCCLRAWRAFADRMCAYLDAEEIRKEREGQP